ncbi:cation:proton antiporter [Gemmatimonadota bacterium]
MNLFDIIAVLVVLAAIFGFLNRRFLKLDPTVGLMLIGLISSLFLILLQGLFPTLGVVSSIREYVVNIDFNKALMEGMLGFLLFAGALHVDLDFFAQKKWTIASLATLGLLISMVVVGFASKVLFDLFGFEVSLLACLIFGALISPTDPIAVMGTLKTLNAPPSLHAKIAGESLFNDGVAVVVFTSLVTLLGASGGAHAGHGGGEISSGALAMLFLQETGGGILLGLLAGYIAYRMMLSIDDYSVEVTITLALVMGCYGIARFLHLSGPIAVVCAGIFIGNRGRALAMSESVVDYLEKFWELIDEILNAILFLLIGIEVLVIAFSLTSVVAGIVCIGIVLCARFVSVLIPISLMRRRTEFSPGVVRILTWAGLRGGISVALVLSLPPIPEKPLLVTCTYVVVLFSIIVQGLTIRRVLARFI